MNELSRTSPPMRERQRGRRSRHRASNNPNVTNSPVNHGPPPPAPSNSTARTGSFSHIRVIPKPPVEETPEQRMQHTNPFTFKRPSFSEEAQATVSSQPKPYNQQANLASTPDGSSFAQKARAAELNAARARRTAQSQPVEDEIPNLSGPISLGTYKFTRRVRANRNVTRGWNGPEDSHENDGENKVMDPVSNLSPHSIFKPPSSTIVPFYQLPNPPAHESKLELKENISNRLNDPSLDFPNPDKLGIHKPSPPQYDELDLSHPAANSTNSIRSIYLDRHQSRAPDQVKSSSLPAQACYPSQDPSALINSKKPSSESSEQDPSSFPLKTHFLSQNTSTTIHSDNINPQPASRRRPDSPDQHRNSSLSQGLDVSVSVDIQTPQESKQAHPHFSPIHSWLSTIQRPSQIKERLSALSSTDRQYSREPEKARRILPPQTSQKLTSELYRVIQAESHNSLTAQNQYSQLNNPAHRPPAPKEYDSLQSSPLPDTLPTASFNLETNQWDPDYLERDMSIQTPTNKSIRGGHSGQPSSRSSLRMSKPSPEVRNPHAIVTTTKSGRPYTNPYMPIDPPPSTARPVLKNSPSEQTKLNAQRDIAEILGRHRDPRYTDQEESRFRALEQAQYGYAAESLDDPFQDQITQVQQHGRTQPSSYAEYAAHQGTYGQLPDYGHQPTSTAYTSDLNASPFFQDPQQATYVSNTGISPYHGQHQNTQSFGRVYHEQPSAYEQQNSRASVRLPAVRGTTDQPRSFLQGSNMEKLSLQEHKGNVIKDQRSSSATYGSHTLNTVKPSRALPIRDPAAYTGTSLNARRNQEALRQNLSSAVASSQGLTGPARTVMNDPHRDRQSSSGPSPTATESTVTGSTLRAGAPMFQQWPASTTPATQKPATSLGRLQGELPLKENEVPFQAHATTGLVNPERAIADSELMYRREVSRVPRIHPSISHDTTTVTQNAGLPVVAIGAGNAFMNELIKKPAAKKLPQQQLEDATAWYRNDPRDLAYAAAVLPYETMHRMNAEQFPIENKTPQTVGHLTDNSQDDNLSDRVGQAATPRPIGHGRPAGFTTPTSRRGPRQAAPQLAPGAPFSTLAGITSIHDKEAMIRSGRQFLENDIRVMESDARAMEAMFGGVYGNLIASRNAPYDYLNHYGTPPAYAIDHNANNNDTLFDPQWFATAPPARVGRDPRREQGEYEDPTQGSAGRRVDSALSEGIRRESGGRGSSGGVRPWGRG